ncbi:hypothetical protein EI427_03650 [Flammeovirga pectinis]|uniref:Uncharacterized protein n=1 Tax=Flammeovirga pectinis TaxID=2494373 RepID=A0A3Q9FNP6_9BACT|nr:hypothetical protein [Flammeovirga pectinis]AZQ61348.1 hypothetical protein EI427_03650 [Flammeovirga pectinis]
MNFKNLYPRKYLSFALLSSTLLACGPKLDEIIIPPLEDYAVGIPILNGDVGFKQLLSQQDVDNVVVENDTIFFSFTDTMEVASTDDIVKAFGSTNTDDFFSIDFPNPITGVSVPFPAGGVSLGFTTDPSNCAGADYCIELQNEIASVSYLRFEEGNMIVEYSGNAGDQFTMSLSNVLRNGTSTTLTETNTILASSAGADIRTAIDLASIEFDMSQTPTLTLTLVDGSGTASGSLSSISLSRSNATDRLKLLFPSGLSDASFDIPNETVDTDYLSDIFPAGADIAFANPTINFQFNNPIGATVGLDLGSGSTGGMIAITENSTIPVSFNSNKNDADNVVGCSQVINVSPAVDFDDPTITSKFMCDAGAILSARPTQIQFGGQASYDVPPGSEIFFSNEDHVQAVFSTRLPLHIGFTGMTYNSGSSMDLDFSSEIQDINVATLRTQVNNRLPISGSMILTTKTSENGSITAVIPVNGGQLGNSLIEAATTDANGENAQETENYLETSLTQEQVQAILNAGYIDIAFGLQADADTTNSTLDPVLILDSQTMTLEMGLLLNATIDPDSE